MSTALLAREIERNKPCFTVKEEERFISDEVIQYIREKLGVEKLNVDRRLQPAC
jgi:hypothetical protein